MDRVWKVYRGGGRKLGRTREFKSTQLTHLTSRFVLLLVSRRFPDYLLVR